MSIEVNNEPVVDPLNVDGGNAEPAPAPESTPEPAPEAAPLPAAASLEGGEPAPAPAEPVYDWNINVRDQKHEIPEHFRSLVKDENSYNEVKEIFTKAYGLDNVKTERDQFKTQIEEYAPKVQDYDNLSQNMGLVSNYVNQTGDIGPVFNLLGINEQQLMGWVKNRLQENETLTPEQQAELQQSRQAMFEKQSIQQQLDQSQSQIEAMNQQIQTSQIQAFSATAPDVVEAVNARFNNPNAFIETVQGYMNGSGVTDVQQAITSVLPQLRRVMGLDQAGQPGQAAQPQPGQAQAAPPQPKPVIPNVQGTGQSPLRQPPKTIADLRKLAQTKTA